MDGVRSGGEDGRRERDDDRQSAGAEPPPPTFPGRARCSTPSPTGRPARGTRGSRPASFPFSLPVRLRRRGHHRIRDDARGGGQVGQAVVTVDRDPAVGDANRDPSAARFPRPDVDRAVGHSLLPFAYANARGARGSVVEGRLARRLSIERLRKGLRETHFQLPPVSSPRLVPLVDQAHHHIGQFFVGNPNRNVLGHYRRTGKLRSDKKV